MVTPEHKVKTKLKEWLVIEKGAYWFCPVQTGYGAASLDFLVCERGDFVAYECKAGGKNLTPRQHYIARQIVAAGGKVFKVTLVNGQLDFEPCGLTEDT